MLSIYMLRSRLKFQMLGISATREMDCSLLWASDFGYRNSRQFRRSGARCHISLTRQHAHAAPAAAIPSIGLQLRFLAIDTTTVTFYLRKVFHLLSFHRHIYGDMRRRAVGADDDRALL